MSRRVCILMDCQERLMGSLVDPVIFSYPIYGFPSPPFITLSANTGISRSIQRSHSAVICLLLWCSPSAITKKIAPIIIYSVKRVFGRRPISHISIEVIKSIPTFTDCNSSATISSIVRNVFISASIEHIAPDSIFCQTASPIIFNHERISMSQIACVMFLAIALLRKRFFTTFSHLTSHIYNLTHLWTLHYAETL